MIDLVQRIWSLYNFPSRATNNITIYSWLIEKKITTLCDTLSNQYGPFVPINHNHIDILYSLSSYRKNKENLESYMSQYLDALELFEKNCMTEYLAIKVSNFKTQQWSFL